MYTFALSLLMGAPAGQEATPMSTLMGFLPLIAIVGIFYFLILRPQNKKQKETQKMLAALKKGDKVVTIGGIHGTIQTVRETTVIVRVDDSTKMEFSRSAISSVEAAAKEDKKDDKKITDETDESESDTSGEDESK